ncbi:MAG: hypothetical protein H0Z35_07705 [Thermoanaerobacteraceae bacterium]|nr:hypothetical protein [Thermoanaerobacteraceae bacterium]
MAKVGVHIKQRSRLHPLVAASYIIVGASIIGMFSYPNTPQFLWIGMGLIGGILLVVKNRYISDEKNVMKVLLSDVIAMLLIILTARLLPPFLGLLKQLIVATLVAFYLKIFCIKYFST